MPALVHAVGNCIPDNGALTRLIEGAFDAKVAPVLTAAEARDRIPAERPNLVLVNRIGDADGTPGVDLIRWIHENHPDLPCMLISNFADSQTEAQAAGAQMGFGKAALDTPETRNLLGKYLPAQVAQP